jgi:hypothetical protein
MMRQNSALAALLAFNLTVSSNAQAGPLKFQSAEARTALLELYTSEGCSSCPPAEDWLSGLKESPGLWKDFVPLAFHVDYWDHLGWRDPWGAGEFSDRQRAYAELWHSDSIYTPGFVLEGREWRDWPGRKDVPPSSGTKAGVLMVSSSDTNHWHASFAPTGNAGAKYVVHAALLAGGLSSNVKAGENRGRRLNHDFIVLTLVEAPLTSGGPMTDGDFVLPSRLSPAGGNRAVAVWVTLADNLEALQATGGWVVPPAAGR